LAYQLKLVEKIVRFLYYDQREGIDIQTPERMIPSLLRAYVRFLRNRATRTEVSESGVDAILVVELTRLGDLICTFPALARLRAAYPDAKITCVVQDLYAPIVRALDLDVQTIGLTSTRTVVGFIRGIRAVRAARADLACSMSPAKRNAIMTLCTRAPVRAGYLSPIEAHVHYLQESPVEIVGRKVEAARSYSREHISMRASYVCDALGIPAHPEAGYPSLRHEVLADALRSMKPVLQRVRKPYVVIHPGAAWEFKEWPLPLFHTLAKGIVDRCDHDVVIVTELSGRNRGEDPPVEDPGTDRIHHITGRTLLEVAAIMDGASVMVGNDSGPLHLASLCGVSVVGLFGPASPELTAPVGRRGIFLYHALACSPCAQRACIQPGDHCMKRISVDEVLEAVRSVIASPMSRSAGAYA
jgi:ADP-heptose:LPS heptosyltransferase